MNLTIDVAQEKSQSIMTLKGEIDIYTASELREKLNDLVSEKESDVIVDLKDVTYMDSTGLGTFISALKHSNESHTNLKLIKANSRLYRLFEVTGLDDLIDVRALGEGGHDD